MHLKKRDIVSTYKEKLEKLASLIEKSDNIVFFGGAGVSTESNIPDFRSSTGLYQTSEGDLYPPETVLSHRFFERYPEVFFRFYKEKMIYENALPNAAHIQLAKLEQMGKLKAVITQNIDGLHQMAGSKNVFELHGSVHRNYCMNCGKTYGLHKVIHSEGIPKCDACGHTVRPDVVLYEEGLDMGVIEDAIGAISNADLLIIGGTSLVVYPAAGLIDYFRGDQLVLINKSKTSYDNRAMIQIEASIGEVFLELMGDERK
ncbi:MAG TPA: NAD-dependent protein deacylase [Clostridiales bacterium UBA8960]|nr:NAD-dependent protein deacylase [Clostridiales bacterium UBA8960]